MLYFLLTSYSRELGAQQSATPYLWGVGTHLKCHERHDSLTLLYMRVGLILMLILMSRMHPMTVMLTNLPMKILWIEPIDWCMQC